ncbi:S41 family peptidase [Fluviispira multicolorata]|uniref:Tail specific protease domain-containing protein n=1 Tax=Fluviispira multicolorata TaxID=2654512 RepID=A0A833JE73_9BACT|nr:S41 family peptidase [Fluviispira multicolorata]KAB8032204.1 hypothetical protein GCL57_06035 [Fluviispira multicolorata]
MIKLKKSILLSSLILITACQKSDKDISNDLLNQLNKTNIPVNENDKKWGLPELTLEEKKNLISSVQIVFNDYYVNRNQKKKEFNYDAIIEANKLNESMDSATLLKNTMSIFFNIKDLHTGFIYPVPARCYTGGFPLTVGLAYENNQEKLIISAKLLKELNPKIANEKEIDDYKAIEAGDEILTIRNVGIEGFENQEIYANNALNLVGAVGRGANPEAFNSRAAQRFFSRSGRYIKIPEGKFTLKVKKVSDGRIVSYTFPWLSYFSNEVICADYAASKKNKGREKQNDLLESNNNAITNNKKVEEFFVKDFYTVGSNSGNIQKKIVQFKNKSFAVIRLNMFIPDGNFDYSDYLTAREYINSEVNDIRNFIEQNKNNIDGVLFDVRSNGGGFGSFPQLIANAFTHQFVSNMSVRPIVSKVNRDTFYNLEMARYFSRLNTVDPLAKPMLSTVEEMDKYLNDIAYEDQIKNRNLILAPADRYDGDENDALPDTYKKDTTDILKPILTDKPIAVLSNSNCYSACDVFVSLFKDYKIAKIFGTMKQTGGGGANVIEWGDFLKPVVIDANGTKSSIIPNGKPLPRGSEIRFAWNKIFRHNAANEKERYIEGSGVLSDFVYRQTSDDVLNNDRLVFQKIFADMADEKNSKGFYLNR